MTKAIWKGTVLAESADTVEVEGNQYFPPDSVNREHLTDSDTTTRCLWKGTARYYDVHVGSDQARDLAWYYPDPLPLARKIRDHVAFSPEVTVQ